MKIIQYKLNSNGSVPEYIIDGGYFPVPSGEPRLSDAAQIMWQKAM
jgi:hypothetical protein